MPTVTVIVLGRDPSTVNSEERRILRSRLGGDLAFIRRDCKDLDDCIMEIKRTGALGIVAPPQLNYTMLCILLQRPIFGSFIGDSQVIAIS
jgi:hypothetical protein